MAKAQRDRSLAQALLESRQLSAAYGLAAQRTHVSREILELTNTSQF